LAAWTMPGAEDVLRSSNSTYLSNRGEDASTEPASHPLTCSTNLFKRPHDAECLLQIMDAVFAGSRAEIRVRARLRCQDSHGNTLIRDRLLATDSKPSALPVNMKGFP
jgi:hypothetical protein